MEPERNNPNRKPPENPNGEDNKPKTNGWVALTIAILVVLAFSTIFNAVSNSQYTQTTWSDFRDAVEANNLSEVEIRHDRVVYMTREEAEKDPRQQKACFTGLPSTYDQMTLANELDAMGVKVDRLIVEDNSAIIMILYYAGMLLLTFFMIRMLMKRMGDGGMGNFGKSKAGSPLNKTITITNTGASPLIIRNVQCRANSRTSRNGSMSTPLGTGNLPFGARPHRQSWSSRDFSGSGWKSSQDGFYGPSEHGNDGTPSRRDVSGSHVGAWDWQMAPQNMGVPSPVPEADVGGAQFARQNGFFAPRARGNSRSRSRSRTGVVTPTEEQRLRHVGERWGVGPTLPPGHAQ